MKGYLGLVVAFVSLTGCTEKPPVVSPADQVRSRSVAYWDALKDGDYSGAYQFLSPGFRARVGKDAFTLRFAGKTRWDGVDVRSVECEEERCVVTVDAQFTFLGNELFPTYSNKTEIVEAWIREGGDWWMVPKR